MGLFPRKRDCRVTFIDQYFIEIRGQRYHHHDYELEGIKKLLKLILKNQLMAAETLASLKQDVAATRNSLQKIREDIARLATGIPQTGGLTEAEAAELKGDLQTLAGEAATLDAENEPTPAPEG